MFCMVVVVFITKIHTGCFRVKRTLSNLKKKTIDMFYNHECSFVYHKIQNKINENNNISKIDVIQ